MKLNISPLTLYTITYLLTPSDTAFPRIHQVNVQFVSKVCHASVQPNELGCKRNIVHLPRFLQAKRHAK